MRGVACELDLLFPRSADAQELDERAGRRAVPLTSSETLWRRHLGEMLDIGQVQSLLNVTTRSAVAGRVKRRTLLALPGTGRTPAIDAASVASSAAARSGWAVIAAVAFLRPARPVSPAVRRAVTGGRRGLMAGITVTQDLSIDQVCATVSGWLMCSPKLRRSSVSTWRSSQRCSSSWIESGWR